MNHLRWGILSTAGIARKSWRSIRDSGNNQVAAVASRDLERSRRFVRECQAEAPFEADPVAFGSYEALLDSPDVDAVYIPLPTGLRQEWVLRAAAARKHVLCEKPCGLSVSAVREMTDACRRQHVQFMDGVMFMHNPRMDRIRHTLDDGTSVGQIKRISSAFHFLATPDFFDANIRAHSDLEPAGCLGDLGWYCLRFTLWAMNWQMPREVCGRILSQRGNALSSAAVPTAFSGELVFNDDTSAGFYSSFLAEKRQWVIISGTKGSLSVSDFVQPGSVHEPSFKVNEAEQCVRCCDCAGPHTKSRAMAQEVNMFRNFANQVRSGKLNEDWPIWALKTQQVMDACRESAKQDGRFMAVKGT